MITSKEYFESLLTPEELSRLKYLPTMSQFVDWFTTEYASNPAVSHRGKL